jgi:hypothetical protein
MIIGYMDLKNKIVSYHVSVLIVHICFHVQIWYMYIHIAGYSVIHFTLWMESL